MGCLLCGQTWRQTDSYDVICMLMIGASKDPYDENDGEAAATTKTEICGRW